MALLLHLGLLVHTIRSHAVTGRMGEAKKPPTRLNNFIKPSQNKKKTANSTAENPAKKNTCYGQLKMCTPRKTEWPRQGLHDRPRRGTTHHHKRWLFSFICATQKPSIGVRKTKIRLGSYIGPWPWSAQTLIVVVVPSCRSGILAFSKRKQNASYNIVFFWSNKQYFFVAFGKFGWIRLESGAKILYISPFFWKKLQEWTVNEVFG